MKGNRSPLKSVRRNSIPRRGEKPGGNCRGVDRNGDGEGADPPHRRHDRRRKKEGQPRGCPSPVSDGCDRTSRYGCRYAPNMPMKLSPPLAVAAPKAPATEPGWSVAAAPLLKNWPPHLPVKSESVPVVEVSPVPPLPLGMRPGLRSPAPRVKPVSVRSRAGPVDSRGGRLLCALLSPVHRPHGIPLRVVAGARPDRAANCQGVITGHS